MYHKHRCESSLFQNKLVVSPKIQRPVFGRRGWASRIYVTLLLFVPLRNARYNRISIDEFLQAGYRLGVGPLGVGIYPKPKAIKATKMTAIILLHHILVSYLSAFRKPIYVPLYIITIPPLGSQNWTSNSSTILPVILYTSFSTVA